MNSSTANHGETIAKLRRLVGLAQAGVMQEEELCRFTVLVVPKMLAVIEAAAEVVNGADLAKLHYQITELATDVNNLNKDIRDG